MELSSAAEVARIIHPAENPVVMADHMAAEVAAEMEVTAEMAALTVAAAVLVLLIRP